LSRQHAHNGIRVKSIIKELGEEVALAPCNAFSISQSTGIPRETVRRKIASLVAKNWLKRDTNGHLFITDLPAIEFEQFNFERVNDFMNVARQIMDWCHKDSSGK
jgi:DNA-binding IclR family transcriptional regulator